MGPTVSAPEADHDDIVYPAAIPFILVHVACIGALWTGVHVRDLVIAAALYFVRMFAITAGFHRYFAHKAFKTGRVFQFILAFLGGASGQQGMLWWAAKHRHHHRYSDTPQDVHSPRQKGFWYSHMGWVFVRRHFDTDYHAIRDFAKYPELRWLNRHDLVAPVSMGVVVFLLAGWSGLFVGFFWSTVALFHGVFMINSLAHVHGRRRYATNDDSRNNWFLALVTLGEGWHNNHHHYQVSARQGFRWWEIDVTYYILRALQSMGVVWALRMPPEVIVRPERAWQKQWAATVEELSAAMRDALVTAQDQFADARKRMGELLDVALASRQAHMSERAAELRKLFDGAVADAQIQLAQKKEQLRLSFEEKISNTQEQFDQSAAQLRMAFDEMSEALYRQYEERREILHRWMEESIAAASSQPAALSHA